MCSGLASGDLTFPVSGVCGEWPVVNTMSCISGCLQVRAKN